MNPPFKLLLFEEEIEIDASLLKYMGLFEKLYNKKGIHEYNEVYLDKALWQSIIALLDKFDHTKTTEIFERLSLDTLYVLIKAMDLYEIECMRITVIKVTMRRILCMTPYQLFGAHPKIEHFRESTRPMNELEAILPEYIYHCQIIHNILKTYIGYSHIIAFIRERFLPRADCLMHHSHTHTVVITSQGIFATAYKASFSANRRDAPFHWISLCNVISISCGMNRTVLLTRDGSLFMCEPTVPEPVKIPIDFVLSMVCGDHHTLALTADGLYTWGLNTHGQLGDGTTVSSYEPKRINVETTRIVKMAAGMYFSIIVTDNGELYGWGRNDCGQLGLGKATEGSLVPVKIEVPGFVVSVSTCAHSTIALLVDGSLYGFGYNREGALGLGATVDYYLPTRISALASLQVKNITMGNVLLILEDFNGVMYSLTYQRRIDRNIKPVLYKIKASKVFQVSATEKSILLIDHMGFHQFDIMDCRIAPDAIKLEAGSGTLRGLTIGHESYMLSC